MTKDRLRNYKNIRREVMQLQDQLRRIRLDIEAPRAQNLAGMPSDGTREGKALDALDAAVARLVDLESVYAGKLEEMTAMQLAIEAALNILEPAERMTMRCHYIDGMTWEEVCVAMSYSLRQVHRIHASALKKLEENDRIY